MLSQQTREDLPAYSLLVALAGAGIGGLLSAQQALQNIGLLPVVLNAASGVLLLAAVVGIGWLLR